jgi:suppressor of cytokine signaling 7
MPSEAAEKLLQNERDGSFIVRDSSDDRYIFSLTFKLNACIRHVRIEHGQGKILGNIMFFLTTVLAEV